MRFDRRKVIIMAAMSENGRGILVAIEGIDGSGKSTQVHLLAQAFERIDEPVIASKEPTDGPWGLQLRESAKTGRLSLNDETQLFIEDRKQHVQQLINPALADGKIVILDRYYFSTLAYQGARGAHVEDLMAAMRPFAPVPDIVLMIDIDPVVGLQRITQSRGDEPNQFEKLDQLKAVRDIFTRLAKADRSVHIVNGNQATQAIHSQILRILLDTVLKKKRCAKSYGCEGNYCIFRMMKLCRWAALRTELSSHSNTAV